MTPLPRAAASVRRRRRRRSTTTTEVQEGAASDGLGRTSSNSNISKTKELVLGDCRSNRKPPTPVTIQGEEVEMVDSRGGHKKWIHERFAILILFYVILLYLFCLRFAFVCLHIIAWLIS